MSTSNPTDRPGAGFGAEAAAAAAAGGGGALSSTFGAAEGA